MTPVDIRANRTTTQALERVWGRFGANPGPRIAALAVADSASTVSQQEVLRRLGLEHEEFAVGIFARCGVVRRHLDLSEASLKLNLQGRSERVERQLFERSIQAIELLDADPSAIGTVVSSSLYSLGTPTLAHRLVEHYCMDPATDKYHVVGVGCASAVPLMRLGAQSLRQHPDKAVLVVAAESMSAIIMPAAARDARAKTVGSAIFGDGCAAALLSRDPEDPGPVIAASKVHHLGQTLGAVSLAAEPFDSYLHLARELPDLAAADLARLVEEFLGAKRLRHADIDHWLIHPGGRRIIESVRDTLGLEDTDVEGSWQVLADHGNVGTPSILYVLKRTIDHRAPAPGERGLVVTIGPGVTVGLMLLEW